jgi:hypothetical protein
MHSVINFAGFDNRVVSAVYRNLMIGAKVVLVEKTSGAQLPEPVTVINSPVPAGTLRIRLPDSFRPGVYYLKALNGRGDHAAQSRDFDIS